MKGIDKALEQLNENPSINSDEEAKTSLSNSETEQMKERECLRQMKISNDKIAEEIESLKQDRDQRKQFEERIFLSVQNYMIIIVCLLFVQGFHVLYFSLSDTVLVALLGTTTVNVIGIFAFVARYLFHRDSN